MIVRRMVGVYRSVQSTRVHCDEEPPFPGGFDADGVFSLENGQCRAMDVKTGDLQ